MCLPCADSLLEKNVINFGNRRRKTVTFKQMAVYAVLETWWCYTCMLYRLYNKIKHGSHEATKIKLPDF